ncbi:hypothetical protein GGTG_10213 [Gaeumannomyces tritici R3-111a-1]|uniref:Uncharacterized protein n=1 Tax=Gaeumannomyces tritici (strain R3-111a-1) TaxID=644352 RepID=J3P9N6_GAET3|nr:hypothetical protein GGTG_10213 [Gaeumannomyces tritici R3-111a-1]EJT73372.1 hypothetical protein GGTG_10213 [Gaeumannomyces tritici R3-111a-1]
MVATGDKAASLLLSLQGSPSPVSGRVCDGSCRIPGQAQTQYGVGKTVARAARRQMGLPARDSRRRAAAPSLSVATVFGK